MQIKVSYDDLESSLNTLAGVLSDRALQDELKNVVFWIKDNKVYLAAYNGNTVSLVEVPAELNLQDSFEEVFQLRAKDIMDVLSTFKGLKRTKVSGIHLNIKENEAVMVVQEAPLDENIIFAQEFYQESKFRITKPRLKDIVKNEVQKVDMNVEGVLVNSADFLLYINALLPTVAKETRDSTSNIIFGNSHIYTVLAPYVAVMPNKLPEVFSGFRLSNTVVQFLKNFVSSEESFLVSKNVLGNGVVVLTFKTNRAVAVIKCPDLSRAFDITNFLSKPDNGVVVDKAYLVDVLRRLSLSNDAALIEVKITKTETGPSQGFMRVISKNMTQNVPVKAAKGEGDFTFSIRAELLSAVVFSHTMDFDENVFLYFENTPRGISLVCSDNTEMWQTKMQGLASVRADFVAWGA